MGADTGTDKSDEVQEGRLVSIEVSSEGPPNSQGSSGVPTGQGGGEVGEEVTPSQNEIPVPNPATATQVSSGEETPAMVYSQPLSTPTDQVTPAQPN